MNLNQRRPTGARINKFAKVTKKDVISELQSKGLSLKIEKFNAGEWNEKREFSVNGTILDVSMNSEKPNWEFMLKEITNLK